MQNSPDNRGDRSASVRASSGIDQPSSLDAAALDLVRAATDDGDDALIRALLRATVALGLTEAATFWTQAQDGRKWEQRRGFGGSTAEPNLPLGWPEDSAGVEGPLDGPLAGNTHGPGLTFRFGERAAIVAVRETFDRDGQRDRREEALETLILLAETLLSGDLPHGEFFESGHPVSDSFGDVAGPLPSRDPKGQNRRRAG